ncbi:MAG: acetylxylan esterase [Prevotella sp.]|jgi:cephalosporin-C deacetylase-like acetyl esterase|nr:acetylxylan esterase [Prevotella sp.]
MNHQINHRSIAMLFILFIVMNLSGQNLLPLDWNIDFDSNRSVATRGARQHSSVCTLLSWERQGYFSGDGNCSLSSTFNVEKPYRRYVLSVRLQCNVCRIQINGRTIASDLKNLDWSDKGSLSRFDLPRGILKRGRNKILIRCSELGYTGGLSHIQLTLIPVATKNKDFVHISLPVADHVCLGDNRIITLHYNSSAPASLRLRIENDFHKSFLDSVFRVSPRDSSVRIDLNRICNVPGFYQITAVMHGKGYSGNALWMAVKPEQVACDNRVATDFNQYWSQALTDLSRVAPDFRIHKVDSLCKKSKRDVYIAEMQSLGGITIRGYYFVPRSPGKHAAVLQVPGYGWGFENIDGMLNDDTDRAELALCVRGHGISRDQFNPGFGVPGVWGYKLFNSDSVAYRGIYMDCVRAVEFLDSRPEIDVARIGVKGGSQGGGLALATAALCADKIAACAYFDPFPCDIRHQIRIRTTCETELKNDLSYYGNPCSFIDVMNIQDLIDTRSFASKIKCPVLYTAALFDDDCPVHGGFTVYNLLTTSKQYKVFPYDGHIEGFSHDGYIMKWLDKTLAEK